MASQAYVGASRAIQEAREHNAVSAEVAFAMMRLEDAVASLHAAVHEIAQALDRR